MYPSHWGLQKSPFRGCLDPRAFYQSPTHDEALARLFFLVEQRRRLGLLMGPAGSGKSLLLEVAAQQLCRAGKAVARVNLLGVSPTEMLCLLAAELGLNVDPTSLLSSLWRTVLDRLAEYRYQQTQTVLLLDNADQAGRRVLGQLARLAQHDPSPESRLTLVLAGRYDRMGRLGDRLLDLAELRIDVAAWQENETADYLRRSLAEAGRKSPVFDEPAVAKLHELTHGIPRRVSQLADLALVAGAGRQLKQIDAEVVESVYQELGVVEV
jgi:type II secretory pathway predicted ATPase ExeA